MTILIAAFTIGVVLGLFYLGGLWFTIQRLPVSHQPALLMLGSYVLRNGVVVFGFYVVMAGSWQRLVACLAGFVLARLVLIRQLRDFGNDFDVAKPSQQLSGRAR